MAHGIIVFFYLRFTDPTNLDMCDVIPTKWDIAPYEELIYSEGLNALIELEMSS